MGGEGERSAAQQGRECSLGQVKPRGRKIQQESCRNAGENRAGGVFSSIVMSSEQARSHGGRPKPGARQKPLRS